ncbi:sensor histidine kinase [Actinokineospora guangxiensis]|uniref:histidine kinase n=1 Tax=Actinokineospora guangxiensis TaxID=1490288 RepID=A0ABW0EKI6_9PSEU
MGTDTDWEAWERPGPTAARRRGDLWVGLAVFAAAVVNLVLINSMGAYLLGTPPSMPEQLLWTAGLTLPLMVRTRFPVLVLVVVGAVFIAQQVRQSGDTLVPSIALFLAIYTVGAWEPNRVLARWSRALVIAAMFIWLGISLVMAIVGTAPEFPDAAGPFDPVLASVLYSILFNLLFFLSAYFFGSMAWLSARREAQLAHAADELRRSQEQNTWGAVVAERVRIARDLHDVVAHHVSVMGVQAGAARRVLGKDPEAASAALRAVEETARVTISELRGLLGVLRADDRAAAPADAHPGLGQLADLVESARTTGLAVDFGVYGEQRPVPDGVALSAYRVVQEALTNVVKHARARRADVRVRYLADSLEVEVSDDGTGGHSPGAGFGLVGMRERVAVHGGELVAGPKDGPGYRVRATLPTRSADREEVPAP